jgi:CRP/FNR family transcriptional regulator, anaerobic regulatory protein
MTAETIMEELYTELEGKSLVRHIKKRTVLLYQGEVPRSAYIVKKGIIKVYSINSSGNEQIVSFYVTGDIFPISWIFGKATTTLYYYETLTDCELLAVDKITMHNAVYGKTRLLIKVFDYITTNYTSALLRITSLEQSRASEKIMFTLYYLLFRFGKEVKPGIYSVRLELTHVVIADLVGLTRETTAIELNKLKKLGIVKYDSKEYVINRTKLEHLMGEDSFGSLFAQ